MSSDETIRERIRKELGKIEIDALYTYKGHYNAANRWKRIHGALAWLSAVIAAASGFTGLGNARVSAIVLAFVAAAVAGGNAVYSPKEKFARHYSSAGLFRELHAEVRVERAIVLDQSDDATATARLKAIMKRYHELNQQALPIPPWAYEMTRKGIARGEHVYDRDKELSK